MKLATKTGTCRPLSPLEIQDLRADMKSSSKRMRIEMNRRGRNKTPFDSVPKQEQPGSHASSSKAI